MLGLFFISKQLRPDFCMNLGLNYDSLIEHGNSLIEPHNSLIEQRNSLIEPNNSPIECFPIRLKSI